LLLQVSRSRFTVHHLLATDFCGGKAPTCPAEGLAKEEGALQVSAFGYGPKGQEKIAAAFAHARQHKEVTAEEAEGCFSAVPACPPWSRESETKEEKESLDRKWVA
jgi:hypothetical protein